MAGGDNLPFIFSLSCKLAYRLMSSKVLWSLSLFLFFILLQSGCAMLDRHNTDQVLSWNLSESHDISQVDWPANPPTSVLHYSDSVVSIQLPGEYSINEWDAGDVYFRTANNSTIETLDVYTQPLDFEAAYQESLRLAGQFDLDSERINSWYEETKDQPRHMQGDFLTTRTIVGKKGEEVSFSLESTESFNDENPWLLTLNVFWHETDSSSTE